MARVQEVAHPVVVLKVGLSERRDFWLTLVFKSTVYSVTGDRKCFFFNLGLSQLVVMMWESEVKPSTVNVHGLAQNGARHSRALNVPAWSSLRIQELEYCTWQIIFHQHQCRSTGSNETVIQKIATPRKCGQCCCLVLEQLKIALVTLQMLKRTNNHQKKILKSPL